MSFENEECGMPKRQRKHIMSNLKKLIEVTDYAALMDYCVKRDLLSSIMRDNIENSQSKWHDKLFIKITKRGPDAFENLKKILEDMNNYDAVSILNELDGGGGDVEFQSIRNNKLDNVISMQSSVDGNMAIGIVKNDSPILEQYKGNITSKLHVIKSLKIHKDGKVPCYPMRTKNRGVIFITNIIESPNTKKRNGADNDSEALIDLFQQLGFIIYHYLNLEGHQFFSLLEQLLKSDVVQQTESFVLALMTHGTLNDGIAKVSFSDGSIEQVERILNLFKHQNCPHLLNKPKIMLFPFCRGSVPDSGHKYKGRTYETDSIGTVRLQQHTSSRSDTIICYASSRGYEAHRDPKEGSWYVQSFCKQMAEHAHDLDFANILIKVDEEVKEKRSSLETLQTANYLNEGFKKLYFNPGISEE